MATRELPEFDDLELISKQRHSATYLAFSAFHFQDTWRTLQNYGATTCNINPDTENDALELEVFFDKEANSKSSKVYASWQYITASICALAMDVTEHLTQGSWKGLSQEQTPENLKIDKNGRRAWGYKRFKLSHLMAFANKNKCTVTVHAPYVYMERKKEAELPTTMDGAKGVESDLVDDNMDDDDDEWKIDFNVKPKKPSISTSVINSLRRTCGEARSKQAVEIINILSYIPKHQISFKSNAPYGSRCTMALQFKIMSYPILHEALESINMCGFVKDTTIIFIGKNTLLKVILKK